jgi:MFS family permease
MSTPAPPASPSARTEWKQYWPLPLIAALGYSAGGLHLHGLGPLLQPLHEEFGWSRAQTLGGAAIVSLGVALGSIPMGWLVDRLGPRRIALVGVPLIGVAVAMLGAATGAVSNWLMLWALVAICAVPVQATVWASAVVTRFDAGRGLALAITLSGGSIGIFALPLVSAWLVTAFGWRQAFMGLGAIWTLALLPLLFLFFRGAQDGRRADRAVSRAAAALLPGMSLGEALRTPALYKLVFASACFAFCILGLVVNFVPILTDGGSTPMAAAGAASLIGVASLVGRLATGAILDRVASHLVGAASFIIPIPACLLLLADGTGMASSLAAAILFGLTIGAEVDVLTYVATRRFGLKNFGLIQGALVCAIGVGSAMGPLVAGATFDRFGGYAPFLILSAALMLLSALVIASIKAHDTDPPAEAEAALAARSSSSGAEPGRAR